MQKVMRKRKVSLTDSDGEMLGVSLLNLSKMKQWASD